MKQEAVVVIRLDGKAVPQAQSRSSRTDARGRPLALFAPTRRALHRRSGSADRQGHCPLGLRNRAAAGSKSWRTQS